MIPIREVIGRRLKLQKRGQLWWGLCPFHPDKNPSFAVYDDHYHCFACGAHGDAIDWLRTQEKLSWR
jgi:DNA primase